MEREERLEEIRGRFHTYKPSACSVDAQTIYQLRTDTDWLLQQLEDAEKRCQRLEYVDAARRKDWHKSVDEAMTEPRATMEKARGIIQSLANFISKVAPDSNSWTDEGGLADEVDSILLELNRF